MNTNEFKDTVLKAKSILQSCDEMSSDECINHLQTPIKLAVFASFSAGKSTFLNALVFKERLLHMGVGEVTKKVFKFSYGNKNELNGIAFENAAKLGELIKQENSMDGNPIVNIAYNSNKLEDMIAIDSPGFGGLEEESIQDALMGACAEADAFLFLFDIAKGASKDDLEKYKKYIGAFHNQIDIWVVFNKLDAESDKTEDQICSLMADTLATLNLIPENQKDKFTTYDALAQKKAFAISSKEFLDAEVGTVIKAGKEESISEEKKAELLDSSRGIYFERKFYKAVVDKKTSTFLKRLDVCFENLKEKYSVTNKALENKEKDCSDAEKKIKKDISECDKQSKLTMDTRNKLVKCKNDLDRLIKSFDTPEFNSMMLSIQNRIIQILRYYILDELGKYELIGGKTKEELLENGINEATKHFPEIIEQGLKPIFSQITKVVAETATITEHYNKNFYDKPLISLSQRNYNSLGDILKNTSLKKAVDNFDGVGEALSETIIAAVAGVVTGLVAHAIAVFLAHRLVFVLIPGIGWILGGIALLISIFGGKSIAQQLIEKVSPKLDEELDKVKPIIMKELKSKVHNNLVQDLTTMKNIVESNSVQLDFLVVKNVDELNKKKSELQTKIEQFKVEASELKRKCDTLKECETDLISIAQQIEKASK